MKKMMGLAAVAVLALGLAGCQTPEERALGGAAIGAATGAAIGGLATGRASGALAGAAIGGIGGAVIGGTTAPRQRECAQYRRDVYGNVVCVAYY
jgi:osmotically inducible lipoprotein OsmB